MYVVKLTDANHACVLHKELFNDRKSGRFCGMLIVVECYRKNYETYLLKNQIYRNGIGVESADGVSICV